MGAIEAPWADPVPARFAPISPTERGRQGGGRHPAQPGPPPRGRAVLALQPLRC